MGFFESRVFSLAPFTDRDNSKNFMGYSRVADDMLNFICDDGPPFTLNVSGQHEYRCIYLIAHILPLPVRRIFHSVITTSLPVYRSDLYLEAETDIHDKLSFLDVAFVLIHLVIVFFSFFQRRR